MGQAMNILLVDDHADTSRALKRLLERMGYQVQTADSVSSALQVSETNPFDIVISDIGLPDGSGLDLMREILQRHEEVKGVALSGFGMEDDIRRSKEAGFIEHITKPVDFVTLESILSRLKADEAVS